MADFTPTAVSKSSNFVSGSSGDTTSDVLSDLLDNRTEIYGIVSDVAADFYGPTPPANPNVGCKWRCSASGGGYAANTVYYWNGSIWTTDAVASMNIPERNVVLTAPLDSGSPALFTTSASSLNVQLNATSTYPVVVSFMNGWDSNGAKDTVVYLTNDNATFWSNLTQNATSHLYIENSSGTASGGHTVIAPVYTSVAPTHSVGLHWVDRSTGLVKVSNGSTWTTVQRVFVGWVTTDAAGVTAEEIYEYNISSIRLQGGFSMCVVPDSSLCSATIPLPYGLLIQKIDINCRDTANATQAPSASTNAVLYKNGTSFNTQAFTVADTAITGLALSVSQGDFVDLRLSAQNGLTGIVTVTYRGVRI